MRSPLAAASARSLRAAGGKTTAIGYDGRLSSPELTEALSNGSARQRDPGAEHRPRPDADAVLHRDDAMKPAARIMVTGSHNPPDYNGFKMMLGRKPFFGAQIQEIGRMAREGDVVAETAAATRTIDMEEDIREALAARLGRRRSQAEGGVGQRQWLGGRCPRGAGAAPAGRAYRAEWHDRRHVSGASSGSDGAEEPRTTDRRGARATAPISASRSMATRTGSAWSTIPERSCSAIS